MGRLSLAFVLVAVLPGAGCYLSHELDDAGRPIRDAGPPGRDAGHAGADLGINTCPIGATETVPCGHCGRAVRSCGSDGRFTPPGDCTGETMTCGLDVMLLADITGSHTGVFMSSTSSLSNDLIVPLESDADVRVGVSAFADYPVNPYGSDGDAPFLGVLEPTHDVAAVAHAIMSVAFLGGNDGPEAEIEGLNDLSGGRPHPTAHPFACSTGVSGGCWRADATWRVIIVMTDVASHSLPDTHGGLVDPYGPALSPGAPDWEAVRAQLIADGTYVYWIVPEPSADAAPPADQARELARQLGEDPYEAVSVYDPTMGGTTPAIARLRTRIFAHFGLTGP